MYYGVTFTRLIRKEQRRGDLSAYPVKSIRFQEAGTMRAFAFGAALAAASFTYFSPKAAEGA
jgi:hypothetical protein